MVHLCFKSVVNILIAKKPPKPPTATTVKTSMDLEWSIVVRENQQGRQMARFGKVLIFYTFGDGLTVFKYDLISTLKWNPTTKSSVLQPNSNAWFSSPNVNQINATQKHKNGNKLSTCRFSHSFLILHLFVTCTEQEQTVSCKQFTRWWLTSYRTILKSQDRLLAHRWIQFCKFCV